MKMTLDEVSDDLDNVQQLLSQAQHRLIRELEAAAKQDELILLSDDEFTQQLDLIQTLVNKLRVNQGMEISVKTIKKGMSIEGLDLTAK